MDNRRTQAAVALLILVLFVAAFSVPVAPPLRESSARLLIAAAVVLVGVGLAALVYASVPERW